MPSLKDLSVELLLYHVLPVVPVRDLLALGATNHKFDDICHDETFWKTKCKTDFNFSCSRTARMKGWRLMYKGLSNPKVFVWGASANGRTGRPHSHPFFIREDVPRPVQIKSLKNCAIVDLIAGGWSFHALDSRGRVYVWGTSDGEGQVYSFDGFSAPGKVAETPLRIELPEPIQTLSCGRKHSLALDAKSQVWTFISWGRPFRIITPALDCSSPDATPIQAECGWLFSAILTASGGVYVWWPFGVAFQRRFRAAMNRMDSEGGKRAHAALNGTIPCFTWDFDHNPRKLPDIPMLPELSRPMAAQGNDEVETRLVKIAAMDGILIGLTNKGHVLKCGGVSNMTASKLAHWEYLPNFSETQKIREHPAFSSEGRRKDGKTDMLAPPEDVHINHITAHFKHFVAYTHEKNSIVLRGNTNTTAEGFPEVIPELQYKSIISVDLGDYHSAALTADGKLYTWGGFQQGALGLGYPEKLPLRAPGGYATQWQMERGNRGYGMQIPNVQVPTEVRFDHDLKEKKDQFCFAACASGWHTGALVIDFDPEDN